jgi:TPP-dependent pyruvate/acetoin dehydrogenase alpha subunit
LRARKEPTATRATKSTATRATKGTAQAIVARLPTDCLSGAERAQLLRLMMLARVTEQRARLFLDREAGAEPAARWRDAIGAGTAAALGAHDRLIAPGRYLAAHVGRRSEGSIGGRSAAVDLLPIAVGAALAIAERGSGGVVVTLLDEGAMAGERWSESLEVATARRLPLVLVIEVAEASAGASPTSTPTPPPRPQLGEAVDAADPEVVLAAVRAAVQRARRGDGPAVLACVTPGAVTVVRGARGAAIHDPIELYARRLFGAGVPRREIDAVLQGAEDEVVA